MRLQIKYAWPFVTEYFYDSLIKYDREINHNSFNNCYYKITNW